MKSLTILICFAIPTICVAEEEVHWGAEFKVLDKETIEIVDDSIGDKPPSYLKSGLLVWETGALGVLRKYEIGKYAIITKINDTRIESVEDLNEFKPGQSVKIEGYRVIKKSRGARWSKADLDDVKLHSLKGALEFCYISKPHDLIDGLIVHSIDSSLSGKDESIRNSFYIEFRIHEYKNQYRINAFVMIYQDDWLFIESGKLKAGSVVVDLNPSEGKSSRKVLDGGDIMEWYSVDLDEKNIRELVKSSTADVTLVGAQEYKKVTLSASKMTEAKMATLYLDLLRENSSKPAK